MRGAAWALAIAAVAAAGVSVLLASRRSGDARRLRADLAQDLERGGIADLGRAQALGRRLVLADPADREAAGALALANALLAVDYGLDTGREAAEALGLADRGRPPGAVSAVAAAAGALLRLHAGDLTGAARLAAATAGPASDVPYPLYALGRARALAGDLPGAARALEAAIVEAPGFVPARAAWAEVRLDLGDPASARATLETVLAGAPHDLHANLLLDEARAALGLGGAATLAEACRPDRRLPSRLTAGCALARAVRARRLGARTEARALAEAAADAGPDEPRLLAETALALAELGAVDRAAALLERARRWAAPAAPAMAWAATAVVLGRGRAGAPPEGPRPADPEDRLIVARAALAAGGIGALGLALDALGKGAAIPDADLAALARLAASPGTPDGRAAAAGDDELARTDDPVRAYVGGLRAQLARDLPGAAALFRRALSGHGDACRAAGEYVATLRALKHGPDAGAFAPLRAENRGCVNLPRP